MTCGAVVAAANSSSTPEVISDIGILFQPKTVNDLADVLLELLNAPSEREQLIFKGYKQAQKFS